MLFAPQTLFVVDVTLIFPHQLFKNHPAVQPGRPVVLVEEWLYFRQFKFHQQKIVLHRAGMQFYQSHLKQAGFEVQYVEAVSPQADVRLLIEQLASQGVTAAAPTDSAAERLIRPYRQRVTREMSEVIGTSAVAWAKAANKGTNAPLTRWVAGVLLVEAGRAQGTGTGTGGTGTTPDFAVLTNGSIRAGVPLGPVTATVFGVAGGPR